MIIFFYNHKITFQWFSLCFSHGTLDSSVPLEPPSQFAERPRPGPCRPDVFLRQLQTAAATMRRSANASQAFNTLFYAPLRKKKRTTPTHPPMPSLQLTPSLRCRSEVKSLPAWARRTSSGRCRQTLATEPLCAELERKNKMRF